MYYGNGVIMKKPLFPLSDRKIKGCLCNTTVCPRRQQSRKSYFKLQGETQGHKVIDLGFIWKGIICGVCMPNMKSLSLTVQKLLRRLKLTTDRQTDKQTDRQTGQKQYAPIIRSGCIKTDICSEYNDFKTHYS